MNSAPWSLESSFKENTDGRVPHSFAHQEKQYQKVVQ